jgi:murein DD-endopeptidase MepM/ murein hydrolase activator NlpD
MTIAMIAFLLALSGSVASADIYRYVNTEGVECFTDAPTSGKAVRIVKETGPRRTVSKKPKRPSLAPLAAITKGKEEQGCSVPYGVGADHDLPVSGKISSTVGLRHDPINGMLRDHKGVDIATPQGTPVRPVASGVVTFSGYRQQYGNTVIIRHEDGTITLYAHNSANLKNAGEPVDRGSTIAFSGSTGRTTGPHLHFEAWREGVNITESFVPGAAAGEPRRSKGDGIRRIVQADGTLVFTNLP